MSALPHSETKSFFSRLKTYSPKLFALDQRPLLDPTFCFPWKEFSEAFSKLLGTDIVFSPQELLWRDKESWYQGISAPYTTFGVGLPGCSAQIVCLASSADISSLMGELLAISPEGLAQQPSSFFDQFSLFLSTQLVATASSLPNIQLLSPQLTTAPQLDGSGYLCLDVCIQFAQRTSTARVFFPPEFIESWKKKRGVAEQALSEDIELLINVEAGRTFLTPQQLSELELGDLLLLRYPFFTPGSDKARLFLTFQERPLFRAKIHEEGLRILDMPLQHEAFIPIGGSTMAQDSPQPEEDVEEIETEKDPEETPLEQEEESSEEKETASDSEETDEPPLTEEEAKKIKGVSFRLSKEPLRVEEMPLTVIVQLAELQMTVGQLATLQPGNLVKLDLRPENDVSLVVNGRVCAIGELVTIGDQVGVQIKELGFESTAATHADR